MTVRWMPVMFIVATSVYGWGQSLPKQRFTLTVQQIARTLSEKGIQTSDQQVTMLAKVVASEGNPALDVISVKRMDDLTSGQIAEARFRVKLACRLSSRCLPFYVVVKWPEGAAAHEGNSSSDLRLPGKLLLKQKDQFTIRSGAHATLVMDEERVHIKVAVVSLENGMAGQKIRVASPDHKQIYVAEVVSDNLLKRSF